MPGGTGLEFMLRSASIPAFGGGGIRPPCAPSWAGAAAGRRPRLRAEPQVPDPGRHVASDIRLGPPRLAFRSCTAGVSDWRPASGSARRIVDSEHPRGWTAIHYVAANRPECLPDKIAPLQRNITASATYG